MAPLDPTTLTCRLQRSAPFNTFCPRRWSFRGPQGKRIVSMGFHGHRNDENQREKLYLSLMTQPNGIIFCYLDLASVKIYAGGTNLYSCPCRVRRGGGGGFCHPPSGCASGSMTKRTCTSALKRFVRCRCFCPTPKFLPTINSAMTMASSCPICFTDRKTLVELIEVFCPMTKCRIHC